MVLLGLSAGHCSAGGCGEAGPQRALFAYAKTLFLTAAGSAGEIDPLIAKASQGWQISRMPKVDLSILRLALAEVLYLKETPMEIVIDEALELSKEFSTHASPRFVNGVLMGILREMGHAKKEKDIVR